MPSLLDDSRYRQNQAALTKKLWQEGKYQHKIVPLVQRICKNSKCNAPFQVKPYRAKVFCGLSCSASTTNILRRIARQKNYIPRICRGCGINLRPSTPFFCSNKCQSLNIYFQYIKRWKEGLESGNKGIRTQTLSSHIRRYLFKKYKNQCSLCGWNILHPITKVVPLEVDHIDGNSENNKEENLQLLCPNCHALTPNFRNLNKGHGRAWRKAI